MVVTTSKSISLREPRKAWVSVILVSIFWVGSAALTTWLILRPIVEALKSGRSLPADWTWPTLSLAVLCIWALAVIGMSMLAVQVSIRLTERGIERGILGRKRIMNWSEIDRVSRNFWALDISAQDRTIQLLPYFFRDRAELVRFLKERTGLEVDYGL